MRQKDEMENSSDVSSNSQEADTLGEDSALPADNETVSDLERLKELVKSSSGNPNSVADASWAPELADKMADLQMFGNIVGAGPLKALFSTNENDQRVVVMSSGPPIRLVVGAKVQKESLIEAVLDL